MRSFVPALALTVVICFAQVTVVQVAKRSAAERAGLKSGDSITGWSHGTIDGAIESTFDLTEADLNRVVDMLATVLA